MIRIKPTVITSLLPRPVLHPAATLCDDCVYGSQAIIAAEERNLLKTYRNERHADDEHIEHVEGRAEEGTLVKDQAIRHQLEEQLQCEDRREEYVELAEQLDNRKYTKI